MIIAQHISTLSKPEKKKTDPFILPVFIQYSSFNLHSGTKVPAGSLLNEVSEKSYLNKLNIGHGCIVSTPWERSDDSRVATISFPVPVLHLRK